MSEPNQCILEGTSGLSTDGGGAVPETATESSLEGQDAKDEKPWFVLWVNSKAERSVRDNLIGKGLEAFVPVRQEIHTWRRGERRKIDKVLIPSVVFVRMEQADRRTVEDCPGVNAMMRDPARKREGLSGWDTLARITNDEMLLFKQMLGMEDVQIQFASTDYSVGDFVRIKGFGESSGKAQIVRIYGDTKTYVGVRVSFLGYAYMQVPINKIEKWKD